MDFTKLKSFFIEDEQPKVPQTTDAVVKPEIVPALAVPVVASVGIVEEKFTKHFTDVIANANIKNLAYSLFNKSNTVLVNVVPDEATRFKSVLATMQANNPAVTKAIILDSAGAFVTLLNDDNEQYNTQVANKKSKEIDGRQAQIDGFKTENERKLAEIEKLKAGVQANEASIGVLQGEIIVETNKIEASRQNYMTSLNIFLTKIKDDIRNITTYLTD